MERHTAWRELISFDQDAKTRERYSHSAICVRRLTHAMKENIKLSQLMKKTRPCMLVNGLMIGNCCALSVKRFKVGLFKQNDMTVYALSGPLGEK